MKKMFGTLSVVLLISVLLVACGDSTATTTSATTGATGTIPAGTPTTNALNTTVATSAGTVTTRGATSSVTPGVSATTTTATTTSSNATTTAGATSSTGLTQGDTGLPAYLGATVIKVGSTFEQTIARPFISQIIGSSTNVKYSVFNSADSSDKILSYYDGEMTKLGLTKVTNMATGTNMMPSIAGLSNLVKLAAYQKSSTSTANGAGIVVLGPMDMTTLTALSAVDPSITSGVKSGDNLVILASNLTNTNS